MRFTVDTFRERISEGLPVPPSSQSNLGIGGAGASRYGDGAVIDLSTLFGISDDEQFLREAYQRVLGRECDPLGFVHFREMLRSHAPRQVVLNHLITSDEARQLGRRFGGLPEPKLLSRHWTYRGRGLVQYAQRAVAGRIRELLHAVLQATRIEHLEHKVDYLLQDLVSRSDRISAKADQSLWTLSEKLDAYTSTVLQKQNHLRVDIATQRQQFDESTRDLRENLDINEAAARERWRDLAESLELLSRRTDSLGSVTVAMEESLRRLGDDAAIRANEMSRESAAREERMARRIEAGATSVQNAVVSGTSAIQSTVEAGTATLRDIARNGTEAIQNALEQRTAVIQNTIDAGAAAIQSTVQTGAAAIQNTLQTGVAVVQTTLDARTAAIQNMVETGTAAIHNAVARLSTNLAQQGESVQQFREELGTAVELQNRSNSSLREALAGTADLLSRANAESMAALSANLTSQSASLATQLSNIAPQLVNLASLSTNLTERMAELLERQSAIEQRQTELRRELEAPRPKPPMVFSGGKNVLVSELDGFIVGVPGEEWRMAAYHAFRGPMEPGLLRAFDQILKPGMVVVDIGANIGVFTLHAARLVGLHGKIYSFEPAPRVFEILKDNVQVNGFLETGVIEFRQMAAWDKKGVAKMIVYEADSGRSTLFPDDRDGREIEVTTVALDQALGSQKRIDVVKIDAEGAEPRILRGMRRIIERNPEIVIFIEFAPVHLRRAGVEPGAFLDELASMGLAVRQVDDVSGELRLVDRDQLVSCFSANLSLSRMAA